MSLDEVRQSLAALPGAAVPQEAAWRRVAGQWERALQARIDALEALIDWAPIARDLDVISCAAKGEPAWPPLALLKALHAKGTPAGFALGNARAHQDASAKRALEDAVVRLVGGPVE